MPVQSEIPSIRSDKKLGLASFTESEVLQIRTAIREKYAKVAQSASGFFKYAVGREGALQLGYDTLLVDATPPQLLESFCGVGNPFTIATIEAGSKVLDIGCGCGFDLFIAAKLVGNDGLVVGVDITKEMVDRAESNLSILDDSDNAQWQLQLIDSEQFPFEDNSFEVVISNGVINLSPSKQTLFNEIFRVLSPGGRLQFADIIMDKGQAPEKLTNIDTWSD